MSIIEIIKNLQPEKEKVFRQSALTTEAKVVEFNSLEEAHKRIKKFVQEEKGEGWLCTTAQQQVLELKAVSPENTSGFIICGEFVNDSKSKSMHVQKVKGGWEFVVLEEIKSSRETDILVEHTVIGRNGKKMQYQVFWAETSVAGDPELRPMAYRFCGFTN